MTTLSPFDRSAILGLCRERVPLGIQARSLRVRLADVARTAQELLDSGNIAEMPAYDIRDGRMVSWAERMLMAEAVDAAPEDPKPVVRCPCCGGVAPVLSPNLIARACQLPPQQEAILQRIWDGKGKPVTGLACIAAMYADDPDAEPEYETARKYLKTQLFKLRKAIRGTGVWLVDAGYQRGLCLVISDDEPAQVRPRFVLPDTTETLEPEALAPLPKRRGGRKPKVKLSYSWDGMEFSGGAAVIVKALAERVGPLSMPAIRDVFCHAGYKGTYIGPTIANLRRMGVNVVCVGGGYVLQPMFHGEVAAE